MLGGYRTPSPLPPFPGGLTSGAEAIHGLPSLEVATALTMRIPGCWDGTSRFTGSDWLGKAFPPSAYYRAITEQILGPYFPRNQRIGSESLALCADGQTQI